MIISVSSDKNLRFSQLLGGAVGPIVAIVQFESTCDVNKMVFSTRSKTEEVCKRLLMVKTFVLSLKQGNSSTSPAKQRLAPVAFNILVLTTITSLAFVLNHLQCRGWGHHLNYNKVGKRRQDCLLSEFSSPPPIPWVSQDRRSRNHLSVLHPFASLFSSDNFFSYFVLAFLNMRWPNMNWCQKCQLRSFFCLSLILYLPLSAVHLPPRIVWDPVCSLDSGLAPVAAVIQQCEFRTTTLRSNLNHQSTGLMHS